VTVTRKSLTLIAGEWTNLYTTTEIEADANIAVGTKIAVQNIGASDVYLSTALTQPEKDSDSFQVIQPNDFPMTNDFGDPGAWAFSPNQGAKINVWVVT